MKTAVALVLLGSLWSCLSPCLSLPITHQARRAQEPAFVEETDSDVGPHWGPCNGVPGICYDTNTYNCPVASISLKCPGGSNIICCPGVPTSKPCKTNTNFACVDLTKETCDVAPLSGQCGGPATTKCCPSKAANTNGGGSQPPNPNLPQPGGGGGQPVVPSVPEGVGNPCSKNQQSGTCIDTSTTTCPFTTLTGACPGASNIRCCPTSAPPPGSNTNPNLPGGPVPTPSLTVPVFPLGIMQFPARKSGAMTGSQFFTSYSGLSPSTCQSNKYCGFGPGKPNEPDVNKEIAMMKQFFDGNTPLFMRFLRPVKMQGTGATSGIKITVYVTAEALSIGSDSDYMRFPLSPLAGKFIGDKFDMSLPTRGIVDATYRQADVQIPARGLVHAGKDNYHQEGAGFAWHHNEIVDGQVQAMGKFNDGLLHLYAGHKKEPIISSFCATNPGKLDFYGMYTAAGTPIQKGPFHPWTYADYSHGLRLVHKAVLLEENGSTSMKHYWDLLRQAKYAAVLNPGGGAFEAWQCYASGSWIDRFKSEFP